MKKFRLTADMLFDAEDITDACNKLSLHFQKVANMIDSDLILEGRIVVKINNDSASTDLTGTGTKFLH